MAYVFDTNQKGKVVQASSTIFHTARAARPYVADLHIHSRFSRACSQQLNIPNLVEWAKLKGIDVLGTGDFLHPLWFAELKMNLTEDGSGFLTHKSSDIKFVLTVEIATMYSDKGKGRRLHNLIFLPDFASAETFQKLLLGRRANLGSDGRPILGMSSKDLLYLALQASPKAILIPAHCLPPDELVHTKTGSRQIQDIQVGELVYTHTNRARKVTEILKHDFEGDLYNIRPWYFSMGTKATGEHPFYAFKVAYCPSIGDRCIPSSAHKKICKNRFYEKYSPTWITADKLEVGDIIIYPRFTNTTPQPTLSLAEFSQLPVQNEQVFTGGSRGHIFPQHLSINEQFGRLIGYYLAEGYIYGRDAIAFVFHENEKEYADDVISLMKEVFGITHYRLYRRKNIKSVELSFSSKLLTKLFTTLFYTQAPYKANTKTLPDWVLHLSTNIQAEILRGWWRGDGGYTVSRQLMNAIKIICLRLGIIPSISEDTKENHSKRGNHKYTDRIIQARNNCYIFSQLAFFEDRYNLLNDPIFKKSVRKLSRRHGWIDKNYIYIPIRKINKTLYKGEVFNLEVEEDGSFLTEFATVHNCWTPWFGIFGSQSGYDSLKDCFEDLSEYIYGIETGLSSDPAMNWRIEELDNKSIVSFSDAHSLPNLGRESTVFNGEVGSGYDGLWDSLKNQKIAGTIEFYPEEGKYHYTGHRNCNVKYSPEDTKAKGAICPVCKRGLTVGVMERVESLATRQNNELRIMSSGGLISSESLKRPGYKMLIPLLQIIAEVFGTVPTSQKVLNEYKKLTLSLGNEVKILTKVNEAEIAKVSGSKIAEGVIKARKGDLVIDPGYDGVYGVVKIWNQGEKEQEKAESTAPQLGLFD